MLSKKVLQKKNKVLPTEKEKTIENNKRKKLELENNVWK